VFDLLVAVVLEAAAQTIVLRDDRAPVVPPDGFEFFLRRFGRARPLRMDRRVVARALRPYRAPGSRRIAR
jgi:hypothetical protein